MEMGEVGQAATAVMVEMEVLVETAVPAARAVTADAVRLAWSFSAVRVFRLRTAAWSPTTATGIRQTTVAVSSSMRRT